MRTTEEAELRGQHNAAGGRAARSLGAAAAPRQLTFAVRVAGAIATAIGSVFLAASVIAVAGHWPAAGAAAVKTSMALALALGGMALLLCSTRATRVLSAARIVTSALLLAIGLLTVCEHTFGLLTACERTFQIDLPIDRLLATETPGPVATLSPDRAGLPGAVSLMLLGAGLLALGPSRRVATFLALATLLVTVVPAVGFLYHIALFREGAGITGIAWLTVIALSAIALGLVMAASRDGALSLMWRDDPGGTLLRRVWPPAVLVPLALGFLKLQGEWYGLYDATVGNGLMVIALIVLSSAQLWQTGARLSASALRRHEAEEALREADRRKDEFLGMLSHELRNPLAPIRNSTYILRHARSDSPQARRAQEVIERQTEHLTRLVDDLLDVTRVARGKIELRRARADLREVVKQVADDLRSVMEARGVAFRTAIPGEKVWVDADVTRLAQIFGNLLHNAAKFTPRGGEVKLSLQTVGRAAEIRVRDTGAGIDAPLLARVFEPFVQGERTLARTEGGLGLGLALVRAIAELHGGTVRAESAGHGKGAEFIVRLPLAAPAEARPEPRPSGRPPSEVRRVLVVDDNTDSAESLAEIVGMLGHSAEIAYDGSSAIAKAQANPPDVVLCDIGLPGISGYEVAQVLRASGNPIQLFAVTGYAQPEDVRKALEAGFDGHVAKPLDVVEIQRLLGVARATSAASPFLDARSPPGST